VVVGVVGIVAFGMIIINVNTRVHTVLGFVFVLGLLFAAVLDFACLSFGLGYGGLGTVLVWFFCAGIFVFLFCWCGCTWLRLWIVSGVVVVLGCCFVCFVCCTPGALGLVGGGGWLVVCCGVCVVRLFLVCGCFEDVWGGCGGCLS